MENVLKQLTEDVETYKKINGHEPDYVIMGWDLAYEVRRMKGVYRCTLSREYVYGIPVLETNITGVLALGMRCGSPGSPRQGGENVNGSVLTGAN